MSDPQKPDWSALPVDNMFYFNRLVNGISNESITCLGVHDFRVTVHEATGKKLLICDLVLQNNADGDSKFRAPFEVSSLKPLSDLFISVLDCLTHYVNTDDPDFDELRDKVI